MRQFWSVVVLFLIGANANYYPTVPPPKLECGRDGIRLHINPSGMFGGHVYVRGFFPQSICHLNYCQSFTSKPFIMDLPYRGPCNIRRKRSISPPSISYDVTVIIQHHPLFVTAHDKAYRLNCVYKQHETNVAQKLDVNDIPHTEVKQNNVPQCRYDVLSGTMNGPIVRFANVGDVVFHKWTCDSEFFGFVVHSCVVQDDSGKVYKFIDERGCVTDSTLFPEVGYSKDLKTAYTSVRAFRYADQVMVHFTCQITTCRLSENGCEGISPPVCKPVELGPIKVQYTKKEPKQILQETLPTRTTRSSSTTVQTTTPNNPDHSASIRAEKEIDTNHIGLEITRDKVFSVETLSETLDLKLEPFPFPTKATIFQHRSPRDLSENNTPNNFTLEVESTQMLILEGEVTEKAPTNCTLTQNSFVLTITLAITQVITLLALIIQRLYYHHEIYCYK